MPGVLNILAGSIASAIKDGYFNLVTLLLPGDGTNGAQNNTFLDSSTNNFTITRNGNTTQGTFSPFSQTGWGNYLGTAGTDYFNFTDSSNALDLGNAAASFEAWVYPTANTCVLINKSGGTASYSTTNGIEYSIALNSQQFLMYYNTGGTYGTLSDPTTGRALNKWYHVVVASNATTLSLFVDGTRVATVTAGISKPTTRTTVRIGNDLGGTGMTGYLSNVRFVSGANAYDASQSSITVPTAALTAITGTQLLTCQSNRFIDNSSNAFAITVNGTPSVQAFSPFAPTAAYSAATNGGSGYFDGTGDYLSNATAAVADFGTGDFTFECWFYLTALSTGSFYQIFSASNTVGAFQVYKTTTSNDIVWDVNGTKTLTLLSGSSLSANSWYHIAVVRSGSGSNNLKTYVNGSQTFQYTDTTNFTVTGAYVGAFPTGVSNWPGYIAGLRILKGTAQAPSGIPTAPPTAITNTSFLLNFTNAGIVDSTAKNVLETVGNAQISTTQSKFGGSSMSFDGTGDILSSPGSQNYVFNGDFTVEGWVYIDSTMASSRPDNLKTFIFVGWNTGNTPQLYVYGTTATAGIGLGYYDGTNSWEVAATVAKDQWVHIAFVRTGSSLYGFVGGTRYTINASISATIGSANLLVVGGNPAQVSNYYSYLKGYIDDLRITKGYARYTASTITVPTAAFALQ